MALTARMREKLAQYASKRKADRNCDTVVKFAKTVNAKGRLRSNTELVLKNCKDGFGAELAIVSGREGNSWRFAAQTMCRLASESTTSATQLARLYECTE